MVRDGIFYALALVAVAVLIYMWTTPLLALAPLLLAVFFLWFFRDPERVIPATPGAVVSPADGKVTAVSTIQVQGEPRTQHQHFSECVQRACEPLAGRWCYHSARISSREVSERHEPGFG